MDSQLGEKYDALLADLRAKGRVAVAFSGGVDSALLLHAAHEALGDDVLAVTAQSALFPQRETSEADEFCAGRGIPQLHLRTGQLEREEFRRNTPERCYLCKRELLGAMLDAARARGFEVLVEGSNLDDDGDFRPGMRAVTELGVASPLKAAGLTKAEIRALSREKGLPTWDKQSFACLATRLAFGDEITAEKLARIGAAEQVLIDLGFSQVRVRVHGNMARIELAPEELTRAAEPAARAKIVRGLSALEFEHVTLDLAGYQTGSMNRP